MPKIEVTDGGGTSRMIEAGNLHNPTTFRRANTVFSVNGIAPTITTEHIGINHPKIQINGYMGGGE